MPPAIFPPGLWAALWAVLFPGIAHLGAPPLPHNTPLMCLLTQTAVFAWIPSGILLVLSLLFTAGLFLAAPPGGFF